jgi:hypothetical protein
VILYDDSFFTELSDNRVVCITGRLGSGKTLIGIELAEYYLKKGYYLVTNTSTVWNDGFVVPALHDEVPVVGLVDEGGMYARTSSTVKMLSAFLRKTKSILIFAGKKLPHEDLCDLKLYSWFDFWRNFRVPFRLWRWDYQIQTTKKYSGYLVQTLWQDYYGIYSTTDPGDFPQAVVEFFDKRAKRLFEKYNRTYKLSDVALDTSDVDKNEQVELSRDMANVASQTVDFISASKRQSGGRKWGR